MIEQSVDEVAESMKEDPVAWAKIYIEITKELNKCMDKLGKVTLAVSHPKNTD